MRELIGPQKIPFYFRCGIYRPKFNCLALIMAPNGVCDCLDNPVSHFWVEKNLFRFPRLSCNVDFHRGSPYPGVPLNARSCGTRGSACHRIVDVHVWVLDPYAYRSKAIAAVLCLVRLSEYFVCKHCPLSPVRSRTRCLAYRRSTITLFLSSTPLPPMHSVVSHPIPHQ